MHSKDSPKEAARTRQPQKSEPLSPEAERNLFGFFALLYKVYRENRKEIDAATEQPEPQISKPQPRINKRRIPKAL